MKTPGGVNDRTTPGEQHVIMPYLTDNVKRLFVVFYIPVALGELPVRPESHSQGRLDRKLACGVHVLSDLNYFVAERDSPLTSLHDFIGYIMETHDRALNTIQQLREEILEQEAAIDEAMSEERRVADSQLNMRMGVRQYKPR